MTEGSARQGEWLRVFAIIGVSLFGFIFIGPIVGFFMALPFYEGTLFSFMDDMVNPFGKDNMRLVLYIVQGGASFVGLALVPAYYWWRTTRTSLIRFVDHPRITWIDVALVIAIVLVFMGFNSVFIEWNANVDLPGSGGFERWARDTEDKATELTRFLTEFSSAGQFVLGFVVIALLAGISEEFVFRGLLQPALERATGNIHVAIWVSAALFSALHMQFFGFLPRVLLGALFGYLYFWSGNLLIPILAHVVNNGFSVVMIYLNQKQLAGVDLENPEAAPWPVAVICTLLVGILLYYFRKVNQSKVRPV